MRYDSNGYIHMTGAEAIQMAQSPGCPYGVQPYVTGGQSALSYNDDYSRGTTAANVTALAVVGLIGLFFLNKYTKN